MYYIFASKIKPTLTNYSEEHFWRAVFGFKPLYCQKVLKWYLQQWEDQVTSKKNIIETTATFAASLDTKQGCVNLPLRSHDIKWISALLIEEYFLNQSSMSITAICILIIAMYLNLLKTNRFSQHEFIYWRE